MQKPLLVSTGRHALLQSFRWYIQYIIVMSGTVFIENFLWTLYSHIIQPTLIFFGALIFPTFIYFDKKRQMRFTYFFTRTIFAKVHQHFVVIPSIKSYKAHRNECWVYTLWIKDFWNFKIFKQKVMIENLNKAPHIPPSCLVGQIARLFQIIREFLNNKNVIQKKYSPDKTIASH